MKLNITRHAQERMEQRQITKAELMAVIEYGDRVTQGDGIIYCFCDVIGIKIDPKNNNIITVYRRERIGEYWR